ncbi:hypothetical protein [Thalassoglobus polymorphus]|uniref:Helix-turn-helix domain protein n=1 Tax=Thalassoglobus polymorphus TaxID=2527994 RepID=A0A517QMU4_9PLAN|nr:hypothetical protein [Thalassoglobus polymorphus]QDT32966.1 hypothetical protein Mal48_22160 [Thalassoglobus polymorphus]
MNNLTESPNSQTLPEAIRESWCDREEAMHLLKVGRTTLNKKVRDRVIDSKLYRNRTIYNRDSIVKYLKFVSRRR